MTDDVLVNGEGVIVQLVLELGLQVGQLLFEDLDPHQDDVLRLERSTGLDTEEELVCFGLEIVVSLVSSLFPLLVCQFRVVGPAINSLL